MHVHNAHTALSVRYGSSPAHERERILRHARLRAAESAWVVERELAQSGKRSVNAWSRQQRDELLSRGYVAGMRAVFLRDAGGEVPDELADDPKNIRFVPVGES